MVKNYFYNYFDLFFVIVYFLEKMDDRDIYFVQLYGYKIQIDCVFFKQSKLRLKQIFF